MTADPALLTPLAEAKLPTPYAEFRLQIYLAADGKEHLALCLGDLAGDRPPLVRIHSECLTGDALLSLRCDCGFQLQQSLQRIGQEGRGVLLYLRQEGRSIGLANKIRAYALQELGSDTVEANVHLGFSADERDYGPAVEILKSLGVLKLRLLTNNPRKLNALTAGGIEVTERIPLECGRNPHNDAYLTTKANKLGHLLKLPPEAGAT